MVHRSCSILYVLSCRNTILHCICSQSVAKNKIRTRQYFWHEAKVSHSAEKLLLNLGVGFREIVMAVDPDPARNFQDPWDPIWDLTWPWSIPIQHDLGFERIQTSFTFWADPNQFHDWSGSKQDSRLERIQTRLKFGADPNQINVLSGSKPVSGLERIQTSFRFWADPNQFQVWSGSKPD